jgi:uncharacterized iron-regulated protein
MMMQAGKWVEPGNPEVVSHPDLMREMALKQAVLLGETHDRYDIHRWQLHVIASLHAHCKNTAVAFEMFPRSVQPALDRWIVGQIGLDTSLEEARWGEVWRFNPALYTPLFHFCRQFRVPMLAVNLPARSCDGRGQIRMGEYPARRA